MKSIVNICILMTVYRNDNWADLKSSLDSITVYQTHLPSLLVIVIDGPIALDIEEKIRNYARDSPVEFIVKKISSNVGLSTALNIGISLIPDHMEYILRQDADDISCPNRIKTQVEFMKEKREIAISSGTVIMFNKNIKNEIGKRKLPEGEKDVVKFAMQRTPITHSCTIFRADIFKEIEYPDTRVLFEDWWLCLRAIKKGYNIDNQSEVLMYVRSGNEMMKRRRGWKYACEEAKFFFDVCSEGILPWRYGFINLSIRFFVRILPLSFIKILYKYKLHAA